MSIFHNKLNNSSMHDKKSVSAFSNAEIFQPPKCTQTCSHRQTDRRQNV